MESIRICVSCDTEKLLTDFKMRGKWRRHTCAECDRKKNNEYSQRRNEKDREKVNARNAKWAVENREYDLERKRKYNKEHAIEIIEKAKECRTAKPEQYRKAARERAAKRRREDMNFRLKEILRKRVGNALAGLSKADRTMVMIGCSIDELKKHLESQFREGMSWDNYGKFGWHIDHVIPCASFDLIDKDEQRKCFGFRNLQPLWAQENWKKGAKVAA